MQVDSKKELEKLLKVTCEVFIMSVTKASVDPMLSFITKVTAVRVRQKPALQSTPSTPATAAAKPLREQVPRPGEIKGASLHAHIESRATARAAVPYLSSMGHTVH